MIKLIVGLGNPGTKYENTRHNIGYNALDNYAKKKGIEFKLDLRFKSFISSFNEGENKIILIKPVTYMNLSGEAVISVINYFKIETTDILVIHDDLDLDVGYIRLREEGSSGGHNGIKNLMIHLKTENFNRLRVGIGKNRFSETNQYVLGNFNKDEREIIDISIEKIVDILNDFCVEGNFKKIMTKYNVKR